MTGAKAWALLEGCLPILWWLVLGLKLPWKKGPFSCGEHDWIGVRFSSGPRGPTMELPPAYLEHTLALLRPLRAANATMTVKLVQSALGKAARIGYIVPDSSRYISSVWGGYSAG